MQMIRKIFIKKVQLKFFFGLLFIGIGQTIFCQWSQNSAINENICTATNEQNIPVIISDGEGGAIIAWYDLRNGNDYDVYAQKINSSGVPMWTGNGVAICTAMNTQSNPYLVSDGTGGAIIIWNDLRNGSGDMYAQKISAAGAVQWATDGVAICQGSFYTQIAGVITDGAGGAIVAWRDDRNTNANPDIYAQRISAAGVTQWASNGVVVCDETHFQEEPAITTNG